MVLKGVVDSESRFIFVDIGVYGKQSDGGRYSASTVCRFSEDFESLLPKPTGIKGMEQKCLSSSLVMRPIL